MSEGIVEKAIPWLGLGAIVMAVLSLGPNFASKMAGAFAKDLKPEVNVTMPSITFPSFNPTINVPDYSQAYKDAYSLFGKGVDLGIQNSPIGAGLNTYEQLEAWWNAKTSKPAGTQFGQQYPIINDGTYKSNLSSTYLPPIQDIFRSANNMDTVKKDPQKSTGEGGNGIFVENGDKDYYVPDNSLYGGSSGMPAPVNTTQAAPIKEQAPLYGKFEDIHEQVEQDSKKNSAAALGGWYVKDGVWRQHGVDGY